MLARHDADVGHQLARTLEPAEATDFCDERRCSDLCHPSQRLQRADQLSKMPRRPLDGGVDRPLEPLDAFLRSLHFVRVVDEYLLVGSMFHLLSLEPRHVLRAPRHDLFRSAHVELKKELSEPISMTKLVPFRRVARPNEIAQGLLLDVGDPHRGEVTAPKKTRELLCVPAIRLYSVSRLDRDERRRDDIALDSHLRELPVETVTARTGLVADVKLASALQLLERPTNCVGSIGDRSHRTHRAVLVCDRDRDRLRMHVQPYPSCSLLHDRLLSCVALRSFAAA